jgi:hypothetical protein
VTDYYVHRLADMLHAAQQLGQAVLTPIEWTLIEHEVQMYLLLGAELLTHKLLPACHGWKMQAQGQSRLHVSL